MNKKEEEQIVNRVLESELFTNKQVLKKLLIYLFEKSLQNQAVHEIDIAIDVFRRGEDFISSDDTIVRVNIHKLRIALERYSMEEGRKEEIIPEIPKRCYTLRFINRNEKHKKTTPSVKLVLAVLSVTVIISLFLNAVFILKSGTKAKNELNPVWTDYFKSNLPVCITLGDPFFFRAQNDSTNENYIVRDIEINSAAELNNRKLNIFSNRRFSLEPLEYSYFSQNNIWPLLDIVSGFVDRGMELHIRPLSAITAEEVKSFNHIVIANINSFGIFTRYLEKTSIRVKTNPRRIIIEQENDSLVFGIDENVSGYYIDHAFLVKEPGPDNNIISLIGDFHASGNKGLSDYITKKDLLDSLKNQVSEKYDEFPEFFEMVVEVTSYNYENFEARIIYFNKLNN